MQQSRDPPARGAERGRGVAWRSRGRCRGREAVAAEDDLHRGSPANCGKQTCHDRRVDGCAIRGTGTIPRRPERVSESGACHALAAALAAASATEKAARSSSIVIIPEWS